MKQLLPRSIPGQLALVMAGALLIASVVNFVLLLGERQRASLFEQSLPAIARFADIAYDVFEAPPPITERMVFGGRRQGPGRYQLIENNPIDGRGLARDASLEARLHESLINAGLSPGEIRASARVIVRPEVVRYYEVMVQFKMAAMLMGAMIRVQTGRSRDVRMAAMGFQLTSTLMELNKLIAEAG